MHEPNCENPAQNARIRWKRMVCVACDLLLIPLCVILGVKVFADRAYLWVSLCVCVLACVPFFFTFEKKRTHTAKLAVLAVMVALSVLGRFAFAPIPHFKPVTAMVTITGIYLGAQSGFLCGALTALLSNILYGQGPWTPFQMAVWGCIGFLAGVAAPLLRKSRIALGAFGVLSGILFSVLMDIWTVMSADGTFTLSKYVAAIVAAIPVTAVYMGSNLIFLAVLAKPLGEKLNRIVWKYGI